MLIHAERQTWAEHRSTCSQESSCGDRAETHKLQLSGPAVFGQYYCPWWELHFFQNKGQQRSRLSIWVYSVRLAPNTPWDSSCQDAYRASRWASRGAWHTFCPDE